MRWRPTVRSWSAPFPFPENVNIEATLTYTAGAADAGGGGGGGGRGAAAAGIRGPSGTVLVHHSMMKLPDTPMTARYFDERVGFNVVNYVDFGTDQHRSVRKRNITRFRLDKKDPNAAVSEPVKPIVFYIDPATPAKWVPFVKRGVESWQAAFEAAGFRNAIVARDAPKDAEWSAEDARYSIVRWVPVNAESQSTIVDQRSGEILSASVDVVSERADVRPDLVLRPGRRGGQARAAAAAARRAQRRVDPVSRGASDRPRARLPAQPEGQLDLHPRAGSRSEVGQGERLRRVDHGRRPVQLRGAAGRQRGCGRPDSEDRTVRQVCRDLGLQADCGREDAGPGREDTRPVGARAGHEAVPALLDRRRRGRRSGRQRRSGR